MASVFNYTKKPAKVNAANRGTIEMQIDAISKYLLNNDYGNLVEEDTWMTKPPPLELRPVPRIGELPIQPDVTGMSPEQTTLEMNQYNVLMEAYVKNASAEELVKNANSRLRAEHAECTKAYESWRKANRQAITDYASYFNELDWRTITEDATFQDRPTIYNAIRVSKDVLGKLNQEGINVRTWIATMDKANTIEKDPNQRTNWNEFCIGWNRIYRNTDILKSKLKNAFNLATAKEREDHINLTVKIFMEDIFVNQVLDNPPTEINLAFQ